MGLKTPDEYKKSVKHLHPKVYLGGERVIDLFENPVTKSVIEAMAKIYDLALKPEFREVMTAFSPLIGEEVNRSLHINSSIEDLEKRAAMSLLTAQKVGTCNYRCVGCDAINTLASVTWEMDRNLGTEYNQRFKAYLKYLQKNDLACSGAMTDAKGDRSKRPTEQEDMDVYVHVVDKNEKGMVVRGAKVNQSGAFVANETMVIPGQALKKGEEAFAVAFAVPNGAEGITYICQYTPFTAERLLASDEGELGNPIYGARETSLMVFDNVFVPWDRIFMCGEVEYSRNIISRFAKIHRMNCGGACKVGFADLIIGATQLLAEYSGLEKVPQIKDKIIDMVTLSETARACTIASALKGREEPVGSGVFLPDDMFGNIAKINIAHGFWEIMKLAGDIAGGLVVTMPSEKELKNPETKAYMEKYYKTKVPASKRMRITKFLQHWIAGQHGPGTWHGAGPVQAQRVMVERLSDMEEKKRLARELAGLKDE
jgi:4-hydroxybutyryl-CoA dehydratase/vinylacetyl-CoA-Delta-isomerase